MTKHHNPLASDDIPPRVRPEDLPPVRTDLDLYRYWRMMMGPLGFGHRRLWLNLIDADGGMSPALQQIDDVPRRASAKDCEAVIHMCAHLVTDYFPGASVTFLYTRPGRHAMTGDDRSWARGLTAAAAAADVPIWGVHFANDEVLQIFAPDDLAATG
jgi:hypothetical protein